MVIIPFTSYVAGVFALINAYAVIKYVQSFLTKAEFKFFFISAVGGAASIIFCTVVGLTWAGKQSNVKNWDIFVIHVHTWLKFSCKVNSKSNLNKGQKCRNIFVNTGVIK